MSSGKKTPPEAWQALLKNTELRVKSGVLQKLENLISNDNTTPQQLVDVILKDVTLAARVLTLANTLTPGDIPSSDQGGELTQAIVRIGFNGLRAICIAAAIMDTFLKKIPHRPELLDCLAQSFDVAVHARNVAKETGANEEDVFIAGLFLNLGELVFWCSSIPESKEYLELLEFVVESPEQAFKRLSGMDFQDMSKELGTEWKLSDLLLEAMGVNVTPDTKAVHLGRRISQASKYGWDSPEINKILQSQLSDLSFDIMRGMKFMRDGSDEAKALAASYDLQPTGQQEQAGETQPKESPPKSKSPTKSNKTKKTTPTTLIRP
jgi:HD-like signal output (HDOD) protein